MFGFDILSNFWAFPGGSDGKESACHTGDLGWIPGLRRFPGEGNGSPLQDSCLENPHGQRSLVCYSPWGRKESDTTEQLRHTRFLEALGCDALFLWVFCFYYKFIFLKILFVIIIYGLDWKQFISKKIYNCFCRVTGGPTNLWPLYSIALKFFTSHNSGYSPILGLFATRVIIFPCHSALLLEFKTEIM